MRTTLKKGIGRGAARQRQRARELLPPGALSPVTLYRQPPPPAAVVLAAQVGRFFAWLAIALAVVVVVRRRRRLLPLDCTRASPPLRPTLGPRPRQTQARLDARQTAAIALVIGYDHRAGRRATLPRARTR